MICLAAPGQGSQTPGFLAPWLEVESFKTSLAKSSEILGLDLEHFGTEADAETIKDTKIAQPLIVAAGIACADSLIERFGSDLVISATCGHSVGEVTAAYVSGILSQKDSLLFVQKRGNEMAAAASLADSSMAAVIGGEATSVLENLESAGVSAANFNGPGQIVAAGEAKRISGLVANPPVGTRVIQLQVAGAFHTAFMESAKGPLAEFATEVSAQDPKMLIWSNAQGQLVSKGKEFLDLLVSQVSNPVRWDKTMLAMTEAKVELMIELLPGGTLSGIAKRAMPGTSSIAIKTPADFDKVAEVLGK